jgi:hypothetical protein
VSINIDIDSSLQRFLDPGSGAHEVVRGAIEQKATELLQILGIPGSVAVEINALEPNKSSKSTTPHWIRIRVNGDICHYPEVLLRFGYSYVIGALPAPGIKAPELLAWAISESPQRLADFFGFVVGEVIASQPAVLLAQPQAEAYIASLPSGKTAGFDKISRSLGAIRLALREVLQLRLSIADTTTVSRLVTDVGESPEP